MPYRKQKTKLMIKIFTIVLSTILIYNSASAQRIGNRPDTTRQRIPVNALQNKYVKRDIGTLNQDSLIKIKLVELAMTNSSIEILDANIRNAATDLKLAKNSWLGSVSAGANINEFVIQNNPGASLFPKYNLGVAIPFDIVAKTKRNRKVGEENLYITEKIKEGKMASLRIDILIRYESYKEKKEQVRLQQISMDNDYQGYLSAQKDYAEGTILLDVMNKSYQNYVGEQAKLVTRQYDLAVAKLQLEEYIGISLEAAIQSALEIK